MLFRPPSTIFQPRFVLLCSLTGAALVGLYLLRYEHVRANVLDPAGDISVLRAFDGSVFRIPDRARRECEAGELLSTWSRFPGVWIGCRKSNGKRGSAYLGSHSAAQLYAREFEVDDCSYCIDTGPRSDVVPEVLRLA